MIMQINSNECKTKYEKTAMAAHDKFSSNSDPEVPMLTAMSDTEELARGI